MKCVMKSVWNFLFYFIDENIDSWGFLYSSELNHKLIVRLYNFKTF